MSEEQQVRLNVHTEKMGTSYANAFQVRYSQDDVLVSFGVSLTDLSAEPGVKGVVTADMLERIAMTPRTAKRLTLTLSRASANMRPVSAKSPSRRRPPKRNSRAWCGMVSKRKKAGCVRSFLCLAKEEARRRSLCGHPYAERKAYACERCCARSRCWAFAVINPHKGKWIWFVRVVRIGGLAFCNPSGG